MLHNPFRQFEEFLIDNNWKKLLLLQHDGKIPNKEIYAPVKIPNDYQVIVAIGNKIATIIGEL